MFSLLTSSFIGIKWIYAGIQNSRQKEPYNETLLSMLEAKIRDNVCGLYC